MPEKQEAIYYGDQLLNHVLIFHNNSSIKLQVITPALAHTHTLDLVNV